MTLIQERVSDYEGTVQLTPTKMLSALGLKRSDLVFTPDQLVALRELIHHLLEIADDARHYGILSLDVVLVDEHDPFIQFLFRLFGDGRSPETVEQLLEQVFLTQTRSAFERFRLVLISTAAFSVCRSESPLVTRELLVCWLGMEELFRSLAAGTYDNLKGKYHLFRELLGDRQDMSELAKQISDACQDSVLVTTVFSKLTLEEAEAVINSCRFEGRSYVFELIAMQFGLDIVTPMVRCLQRQPSQEQEATLAKVLDKLKNGSDHENG